MATYWENSCSFGLRYVSWYKYLIVSLVFSHLGFWSGNLFLIAPFPDLCLLVPFDETFNDNLFATKGYKMESKDRNARGGGLMVFYRSDLPVRRKKNFECEESESIFLELKLKNSAWCIPCVYRPPSTNDTTFENDFSTKLDQMLVKYEHICVIGDLNYNLLIPEKAKLSII